MPLKSQKMNQIPVNKQSNRQLRPVAKHVNSTTKPVSSQNLAKDLSDTHSDATNATPRTTFKTTFRTTSRTTIRIGTDSARVNTNPRENETNVITFNLLSNSYISNSYFPNSDPKMLKFGARKGRVKGLIDRWTREHYIICFQEVCDEWRKALTYYFDKTPQYEFYGVSYANGKMGVGIAYPVDLYEIVASAYPYEGSDDIKKIYKSVKKTVNVDDSEDTNANNKVRTIVDQLKEACSPYVQSKMLSMLLKKRNNGKHFIVATYHMPCKFTEKFLMMAHIHIIKKKLMSFKKAYMDLHNLGNISVILAGDFNSLPDSSEYALLTNKKNNDPDIMLMNNLYSEVGESLYTDLVFESAHMKRNNEEPEFTNVADRRNVKFKGCIDYIFVTDELKIRACTVGLIKKAEKNDNNHGIHENVSQEVFPSWVCPSDHLPLSCAFTIEDTHSS